MNAEQLRAERRRLTDEIRRLGDAERTPENVKALLEACRKRDEVESRIQSAGW